MIDYAQAAKWFRKAAGQGYAIAQHYLGVMYRRGQGVTQDHAQAAKWYRKAAEKGYAHAQRSLGLMYYKGEGVIQDNVTAHMWWNIAASKGDNAAWENRGIVEKEMTSTAIEKANKRALICVKSNYKQCD